MESDHRAEEFILPGQRQLPGRWKSEWLNLTGLGALPASRSWGEEDRKTRAWTSLGHSATESPKESENSWLSKEEDKGRYVKGGKKTLEKTVNYWSPVKGSPVAGGDFVNE